MFQNNRKPKTINKNKNQQKTMEKAKKDKNETYDPCFGQAAQVYVRLLKLLYDGLNN